MRYVIVVHVRTIVFSTILVKMEMTEKKYASTASYIRVVSHTRNKTFNTKILTDGVSKEATKNTLTAVHLNQYFSSIGATTISHLLPADDNTTENAIFWRG